MISIRKGCFETNSSSMHSLAIWKKVKPYDEYDLSLKTLYHRDKSVFELFGTCDRDEEDYSFYRYPYRQLTTPIEKLRYIVGIYIDHEYPKKEGSEDEYDYSKEPTYFFRDKEVEKELTRLVKKYTQCEKIEWYFETEEMGYNDKGKREWQTVTHWPSTSTVNDSGEDIIPFMKRKNISLEDLIFKPNYTIQVDGDEYQEFKDMFDFNMINLDNLEDISSGVDYWTDSIETFYIHEALTEEYGCWGKSYLEAFDEMMQDKKIIELEDYEDDTSEEHYKVAAEFLRKYRDKVKFEITSYNKHIDLLKKYFGEGTEYGVEI